MKKIKADVMYEWNHGRNPGCNFYPGDRAKVAYKYSWNSNVTNRYVNKEGIVIAVSSGSPGLVRGRESRQFTRYYLHMPDGEIISSHAHVLTKVC